MAQLRAGFDGLSFFGTVADFRAWNKRVAYCKGMSILEYAAVVKSAEKVRIEG